MALQPLRKNDKIVIRSADKGGGVVIQDFIHYKREAYNILYDTDYYEPIWDDPFPHLNKSVQLHIRTGLENEVISKDEFRFHNIQLPSKPVFYHLPKIHKDLANPPGRPIISGVNSAMSNFSRYLDVLLQVYVKCQPTYLKDSDNVIKLILDTKSSEGLSFLTMDVTSLYSNIEHHQGIKCVENILSIQKYHLTSANSL